jgi:hypothetical protein
MAGQKNSLYTLISLEDFKGLLGVDDREEKLAKFCLVTATLTIEQYCMRKFLRKKYFEKIEYSGDLLFPLREYPVSEVLSVYVLNSGEIIEPEFYRVIPDCGSDIDLPFAVELSPAYKYYRALTAVKVVYKSGYVLGKFPADLASACMELAGWNLNRYRGRRVGMTGNIRGAGKEGEHFELSMPENGNSRVRKYLQLKSLIFPFIRLRNILNNIPRLALQGGAYPFKCPYVNILVF